jgi:hypothetical protein
MPNQNMLSGVKLTGMLAGARKHVPLPLAYPLPIRGVNARLKGSAGRSSPEATSEFAALLPCIIEKR